MSEAMATAAPARHPIRLRVTDDLRRTRLTVFFRLLLAIPLIVWQALIGLVVLLTAIGNWFATLFAGRSPAGLHSFIAGFLRYTTHLTAYVWLIADPYPGFYLVNLKQDYPIDLEIDPPEVQNRWTVAFRIILAIPAFLITGVLRQLSQLLAVFSWFVALITGRVPEGVRNFAAFALRYESQTYGYVLLLTQRYPSFNVGITA
jgi:Domain of unknown function (DUF4389)